MSQGEQVDKEDREAIKKEAQDKVDEWLEEAVRETEKEMFLSGDPEIDFNQIKQIHEIDMEIRRNGGGGLWEDVNFEVHEENDDLTIESFGVPLIPQDIPGGSMEIDEATRREYNDVLSDFGVEVSYKMDEKLQTWLSNKSY